MRSRDRTSNVFACQSGFAVLPSCWQMRSRDRTSNVFACQSGFADAVRECGVGAGGAPGICARRCEEPSEPRPSRCGAFRVTLRGPTESWSFPTAFGAIRRGAGSSVDSKPRPSRCGAFRVAPRDPTESWSFPTAFGAVPRGAGPSVDSEARPGRTTATAGARPAEHDNGERQAR